MKNLIALFVLVALIVVIGCQNDTSGKVTTSPSQIATQEKLATEVMAVHDEAMPKMAEMARLAQEIRRIIPSDAANSEVKEQAYQLLQRLNIAEEGMMGWMHYYKLPEAVRDTMQHDAVMQYLAAEKEKIAKVGVDIETGMEAAKTFLSTLNSK